MRSGGRSPDPHREVRKSIERGERAELLGHLQSLLEPAMAVLGLVFLGMLLLDFASVDSGGLTQVRIDRGLQIIWVIFLLDFGLRFIVAPAKAVFVRENWLPALSLVLPFLRPLRAFQAARALRSLSLVRLLGGINRGIRVLRQVTRGRQIAYVAALTIFVVLAGAVGVLYFDRGIEGAPIQSFGDALWWSAAMVTTINNEKYAVSAEARIIAVLQRIYAISIFGFVTASIATYLIGSSRAEARAEDDSGMRAELAALRLELARLQRALDLVEIRSSGGDDLASSNNAAALAQVPPADPAPSRPGSAPRDMPVGSDS